MAAAAARVLDVEDERNAHYNPIYGLMGTALVTLAIAAEMAAPAVGADLAGSVFLAMMFARRKLQSGEDPHGLSAEEIGAIHMYTQDTPFYGALNGALRDKDRERLKPFFAYLKLLLTALHKLPRQRGTVYRGVKLAIAQLGIYAQGEELLWWGFSSTTTGLPVLENPQFLGQDGDRTMFHIHLAPDSAAVDIRDYSALEEAEVLLAPGTFLRVEGVANLGGALHMVQLQQLPAPPLVDFARPASPEPAAAAAAVAAASAGPAAAAAIAATEADVEARVAAAKTEAEAAAAAAATALAAARRQQEESDAAMAKMMADMEQLQTAAGGGGAAAATAPSTPFAKETYIPVVPPQPSAAPAVSAPSLSGPSAEVRAKVKAALAKIKAGEKIIG